MRDDVFFHYWAPFQKLPVLLLRAKLHHIFDAGTVIPTPIEDNDLARGGKVRHVALHVHLALLTVGWSRKRHHPENSRADPLRDGFDRAAFARAITAFKHDDDTQSFVFYPVLEEAELRLKPEQFFFVVFSLHLLVLHIPVQLRMTVVLTGASRPIPSEEGTYLHLKRLENVRELLNPVHSSDTRTNFQELLIGIGECLLLMRPTKQKLLMPHRPLGNLRAISSHKPDLGSAHLAHSTRKQILVRAFETRLRNRRFGMRTMWRACTRHRSNPGTPNDRENSELPGTSSQTTSHCTGSRTLFLSRLPLNSCPPRPSCASFV